MFGDVFPPITHLVGLMEITTKYRSVDPSGSTNVRSPPVIFFFTFCVFFCSDGRREEATSRRRGQQNAVRRLRSRRPGAQSTGRLWLVAVLDNVRAVPAEVPDRLAPAGHHLPCSPDAIPVRLRRRQWFSQRH